jgi:hypothetical protein
LAKSGICMALAALYPRTRAVRSMRPMFPCYALVDERSRSRRRGREV